MSAGCNTAKPFSWMKTDAGDTLAVVDRTEERDQDGKVPTGTAATVTSGWYPRATPPSSQHTGPSGEGCSDRGALVAALPSPSNENNAWSFATREGVQDAQPLQPSLAWEATVGAVIRESSGAGGKVRRRDMPRDTPFVPRTTNVFDGLGGGLAAFPPSALAVCGGSPGRRSGTKSARVARRGSPRGSGSPDRWSAYSGEKS